MLGSIIGTFYRNKLKNTNQTEFRVEKLIKRKDDVKWKGYDDSFNNRSDKKDIVL